MYERIKNVVTFFEIATEYNLELEKKIDCPICRGKNSFHIHKNEFFKCFRCGNGGDVIALVALIEGISMSEAMRMLAQRHGINYQPTESEQKNNELSFVLLKFLENFKLSDKGLQYLHSRGLDDKFIGSYGFFELPDRLPVDIKNINNADIEILSNIGLYDGYTSMLRGCVVVPFWKGGQISYVTGRNITGDDRPKYINIRGKKPLLSCNYSEITYIVEGIFDFLLLRQAGVSVIATAGSGAMPDVHERVKIIKLCFDPDAAGEKYTEKFLEQYNGKAKIEIMINKLDPADVLREPGDDRLKRLQFVSAQDYYLEHYNQEMLFRVCRSLSAIERDTVFKAVKNKVGCTIAAVRKDYEDTIRSGSQVEFIYGCDSYIIPDGFSMNSEGLFEGTNRLCYSPLVVSGVGSDLTGKEYARIGYEYNGQQRERVESLDVISNQRNLLNCSAYGAPVNSKNAVTLTAFFRAFLAVNKSLPRFQVANQIGWVKQGIFLMPDEVIVSPPGDPLQLYYIGDLDDGSYSPSGKLTDWCATMRSISDERSWPVRLALYASFASSVWSLMKMKPIVIHFHGATSKGKTTACRVAASVWGLPDNNHAMISWNSTTAFFDRIAIQLNNIPLIIDESSGKTDDYFNKELRGLIYQLSGGGGKNKALRDSSVRVSRGGVYSPIVISSGESGLLAPGSFGGQMPRVVDLYGNPFGFDDVDFVDWIVRSILDNYGFAGRKFIKEYNQLSDDEKQNLATRQIYDTKAENNVAARLLSSVTKIFSIGQYINEIFELGYDVRRDAELATNAIIANLNVKSDDVGYIYEAYSDFLLQKQQGFLIIRRSMTKATVDFAGRSLPNDVYGYVSYDEFDEPEGVFFLKRTYNAIAAEIMNRAGNAVGYVTDRLTEAGMIEIVRRRFGGNAKNAVWFKDLRVNSNYHADGGSYEYNYDNDDDII